MPFMLTVGGDAYLLAEGTAHGKKRVVKVDRALAKRARYIGASCFVDKRVFIVFLDPQTQKKFMQLQPKE